MIHRQPSPVFMFHAALAPRGHLALEVPCAIAPASLPPGRFTFEHLHYYQRAILEHLLQSAGFKIVETRIHTTAEHYPMIATFARKGIGLSRAIAGFDPSAGALLAHSYAKRDKEIWTATARRVARVQEPAFLYGAGIHTAQLLDRTNLASCIIAIADRAPKKWCQTQAVKPVISPAEIIAHSIQASVVISSYVSER